MSVPMNRTAIVLLASGLSRRYGRRDKMLADLGGQPLIEHAAGAIMSLDPLTRVAVCPTDRPAIGERLIDRFVVAVNKKPKQGLGHSIAVGVQIALQFKPDAILLVMGDMPFVESWMLEGLMERLGAGGVDIVHSGSVHGARPPTAFGPACFDQLAALDGDDGASRSSGRVVSTWSASTPRHRCCSTSTRAKSWTSPSASCRSGNASRPDSNTRPRRPSFKRSGSRLRRSPSRCAAKASAAR